MRNQNIKHVIDEIVEIARMQASLQKIEIELDMRKIHLAKMQFDNQRFQQVLLNLLSNAIKFSKRESTIKVEAALQL